MEKQSTSTVILSERDIEIDNLKTIIIALNQKVKAKDDLEKRIDEQKKLKELAEEARDELRMLIEENN